MVTTLNYLYHNKNNYINLHNLNTLPLHGTSQLSSKPIPHIPSSSSLLFTFSLDLSLSDRDQEVILLGLVRHGEGHAIEQLVFEHHHRVWVSDGGLDEPLSVLAGPRRNHLKGGDGRIPRRKAL